ncbi:unnamed protein product, partial [Adineta steineri]
STTAMNNNRIEVLDPETANSNTTESSTTCECFRKRKLLWIIIIIVLILVIIIPIIILTMKKTDNEDTLIPEGLATDITQIAEQLTTEITTTNLTTDAAQKEK